MNGILVEKQSSGGDAFWVVRDVKTRTILAVGSSASNAVQNYEVSQENEKMMRKLGVNLDDLTF